MLEAVQAYSNARTPVTSAYMIDGATATLASCKLNATVCHHGKVAFAIWILVNADHDGRCVAPQQQRRGGVDLLRRR